MPACPLWRTEQHLVFSKYILYILYILCIRLFSCPLWQTEWHFVIFGHIIYNRLNSSALPQAILSLPILADLTASLKTEEHLVICQWFSLLASLTSLLKEVSNFEQYTTKNYSNYSEILGLSILPGKAWELWIDVSSLSLKSGRKNLKKHLFSCIRCPFNMDSSVFYFQERWMKLVSKEKFTSKMGVRERKFSRCLIEGWIWLKFSSADKRTLI